MDMFTSIESYYTFMTYVIRLSFCLRLFFLFSYSTPEFSELVKMLSKRNITSVVIKKSQTDFEKL